MDSEASLPGLVAVTRTSDVERDLKAILRLTRPAFNNVKPKDWYFVFDLAHVILVSPQSQLDLDLIWDCFGIGFGSKGTGLGTRA